MKIRKGAVGYAPVWPFKVQWNGVDWDSQMGPTTEWFWHYFVRPLWRGSIVLNAEDVQIPTQGG